MRGRSALVSMLAVFLLASVSGGAYAKAQKTGGMGAPALEARLRRLLEPSGYRYDPAGKPDPFRPFVKTTSPARRPKKAEAKGKAEECTTPLACMDVGQLKLVAIVTSESGRAVAMAQDAAGIGYIIEVGDRIGRHSGRVSKILPDRVIVTEKALDIRGRPVPVERILLLHPEEE